MSVAESKCRRRFAVSWGRGGGGLAGEGSLVVKGWEKPLEKAGLDLVSKNRE